jgi:hypothetical protein
MKQKAFHIAADGSIEQCRKFPKCKLEDHWAEEEHVRVHLDNIAYRAEVDAKVAAFNEVSPQNHFRAHFADSLWHASARKFGEQMDEHVAQYGSRPRHISGYLRFTLKFLHEVDIRVVIETYSVIDTENGRVTRKWTATAMEYHHRLPTITHHRQERNHEKVLKTLDLDFSGHGSDFKNAFASLEQLFEFAVQKSDPLRGKGLVQSPYAEEVKGMMDRFMDMFNAIEGASRTDAELFYEGHGDFKDSVDNTVVVDVEYQRSAFSAQTFKDFVRSNYYYRGETIDADIRVRDSRGKGDAPASWTLYRKGGIWRVAVRCWDGREFDTVATTAEEVRGHVYWQMMNEVVPNKQDEAFKVSQYAADLFTMVESELAAHNG